MAGVGVFRPEPRLQAWSVRQWAMIVFVALFVDVSFAAEHQPQSLLLGERPSLDGEPTVVNVNVLLIDIDDIDDVNQRFSVDMFIGADWHDPRLALPPDQRKGQERFMSLEEIWAPRILFLNNRGLTTQLRDGVSVDDLGNVQLRNRLTGQLAADLQFQEFPFDVQQLPIQIVSYQYTTNEMVFKTDESIFANADVFSVEGWHLTPSKPVVSSFISPINKDELPYLTYIVEAQRDSSYYVLTMLVPMSLIIFMAWTVFWLQPGMVPPRISISTAAIFSLIALGVSIRLGLPKISYLTKADVFVLGCTLLVFIALGVAVIGSRWANSDRMPQALKANAIARWVYLLLFGVVTVFAFYI